MRVLAFLDYGVQLPLTEGANHRLFRQMSLTGRVVHRFASIRIHSWIPSHRRMTHRKWTWMNANGISFRYWLLLARLETLPASNAEFLETLLSMAAGFGGIFRFHRSSDDAQRQKTP